MKTRVHRWLAAVALTAAALVVAGIGSAGDDRKPFTPILPDNVYKELVGRAAKVIEENADSKDDDARKQAQVAAVRSAAYSLLAKGEHGHLGAKALQLAAMIKDKKHLDAVKKEAAKLVEGSEDKAQPIAVAELPKHLDEVLDLMNLYRTKMKGGEGLPEALQSTIRLKGTQNGNEEKIRYLALKKMMPAALAKEADELALFGYKVAADGALTSAFASAQKQGGKDWMEFSLAMRDAGVALAEAARAKDADAVFKAATSLNTSCTQCHSMFRKSG